MATEVLVRETPLAHQPRRAGAEQGDVRKNKLCLKPSKFFGLALTRSLPVALKAQDASVQVVVADGICKRPLPNQALVDWAKHMPREKGGFCKKVSKDLSLPRPPRSAFTHFRLQLEESMLKEFPGFEKDSVGWMIERKEIASKAREKFKQLSDADRLALDLVVRGDKAVYTLGKEAWEKAHPGQGLPGSAIKQRRKQTKAKQTQQGKAAEASGSRKRKAKRQTKVGTAESTDNEGKKPAKVKSQKKQKKPEEAEDVPVVADLLELDEDSETDASDVDHMGNQSSSESEVDSEEDEPMDEADSEDEQEGHEMATQEAPARQSTRFTRSTLRITQQTPPAAPKRAVFAPIVDSKSNRPATPHKRRRLTKKQTSMRSVPFADTDVGTQELSQRPADPVNDPITDASEPIAPSGDDVHAVLSADRLAALTDVAATATRQDGVAEQQPTGNGASASPGNTRSTRSNRSVATRSKSAASAGTNAPSVLQEATQELSQRPTRSRAAGASMSGAQSLLALARSIRATRSGNVPAVPVAPAATEDSQLPSTQPLRSAIDLDDIAATINSPVAPSKRRRR